VCCSNLFPDFNEFVVGELTSPRVGSSANCLVSFVSLYLDNICIILQLRHTCLYVIMIVSGDDNQTSASSSAVFSKMCSKANRPIVLVLCLICLHQMLR